MVSASGDTQVNIRNSAISQYGCTMPLVPFPVLQIMERYVSNVSRIWNTTQRLVMPQMLNYGRFGERRKLKLNAKCQKKTNVTVI